MLEMIRKFSEYKDLGGICYAVAALSHRFLDLPELFTIRHSALAHPLVVRVRTSDIAVFREVMVEGDYDFPLSFSPKTILDLGANCGVSSALFASKYPLAKVVAVEPEPKNFIALVRNCKPYKNIVPIEGAAWTSDGRGMVGHMAEESEFSQWDYQINPRGSTEVQTFTIDTLARMLSVDGFDFIKCDIEGGEKEIFSRPGIWLTKAKVIMVEVHDRFIPDCARVVQFACGSDFRITAKHNTRICERCSS